MTNINLQLIQTATINAICDLRDVAKKMIKHQISRQGSYDPLPSLWLNKYPGEVKSWILEGSFYKEKLETVSKPSFDRMPLMEVLNFCFTADALRFVFTTAANPHDFWLNIYKVLDAQFSLTRLKDGVTLPILLSSVKSVLLSQDSLGYFPAKTIEKHFADSRTRLLSEHLEKVLSAKEAIYLYRMNIILYSDGCIRDTLKRQLEPIVLHPLVRGILTGHLEPIYLTSKKSCDIPGAFDTVDGQTDGSFTHDSGRK